MLFHDCRTVFDFEMTNLMLKFKAMKNIYFHFFLATLLLSVTRIENLSSGIFTRKTDSILTNLRNPTDTWLSCSQHV